MYHITLTRQERGAIDFVGDRYVQGHDLFRLLRKSLWIGCPPDEDDPWRNAKDITFTMEEHVAWEIKELLEDCNFELFGGHIIHKLTTFLESIV